MKKPDLPYLVRRAAKGRDYYYFEREGTRIRLPSPDDPAFLAEYSKAKHGGAPASAKRTWRALIEIYRGTPAWADKAERTKKDYAQVLDWVGATMGDLEPAAMERLHVIRIRDEQGKSRRRFANYIVQLLSILMEVAIDEGWMTHNPAKGVPLLQKPRREADLHRPWAPDELTKVCNAAAPGTAAMTLMELELGLGQRTGDVVKFDWSMWKDGHFVIKQSKTGKEQHLT